MLSDEKAAAAVGLLADKRRCALASEEELADARWVYDLTVHPVLDQPIPSAFRACSFIPMTTFAAIGLAAAPSSTAAAFGAHFFYQSHSAAMRYCNYEDTSRPLDPNLMLGAYAASSSAACAIGIAGVLLAPRVPMALRTAAQAAPHIALGCAGALSTVMNNGPLLTHGAQLVDERDQLLGSDEPSTLNSQT